MSNLLERAIIDAKALKEAALKNAEQLVIEKYSLEVKEAMDHLLEQEEEAVADLFGDEGTEDSTATGQGSDGNQPGEDSISVDDIQSELPDAFLEDEDEMITIKLDSLDDELDFDMDDGVFGGDDKLEDEELGIDITDEEPTSDIDLDTPTPDSETDVGVDIAGVTPEALEEMVTSALKSILSEEEELEEDIEVDLDLMDEDITERVRVQGEPQKSGWAGTPESIMKEYESMLLAREQDSEVKEENEELRKTVAALQKENRTLSSAATKLQERNKKFNTAFQTMQEKLETMNVSNAKLLYINQALENASLNERQKRKIVEAISKAGTVQEAKIVFETMNDTVATTSDVKKEVTLSEMVSKKSSLLVAARKEQPKNGANPMYSRLQTLAGIKTK
jgi:hypothetical protein